MFDRARIKKGLQLGQGVMLAFEIQPLAGLKGMEHRFHRLHILAQLWYG